MSLTITPSSNAAALVAALLRVTPGITITGTPTVTGKFGLAAYAGGTGDNLLPVTADQAGLFTNGTDAGLPLTAGIVLSTGGVEHLSQANATPFWSTYLYPVGVANPIGAPFPIGCGLYTVPAVEAGSGRDTDLETLLTAEFGAGWNRTLDACVLEFDFVPDGDRLSLQLVFGSEEYDEYVGSQFTDAVAVFLDGVNVGALPNGTLICVNAVNGGVNSEYFTDNSGGAYPIELDGLVGRAPGFPVLVGGAVTPGETHHLKIVIADVVDGLLDSAVFLGDLFSQVTMADPDLATECVSFSQKIANRALSRIGISKQITALATATTVEAVTSRLHFEEDVDTVLRDFDWPFATRYADLVLVDGTATVPVNKDWTYSYRAPTLMIKARRIVSQAGSGRTYDPNPVPFRVGSDAVGPLIYCNAAASTDVPVQLEYTTRMTCPALQGDALFRNALVWRHAASLAMPLSRDEKRQATCLLEYQKALIAARVPAAAEQQTEKDGDAGWLTGRG